MTPRTYKDRNGAIVPLSNGSSLGLPGIIVTSPMLGSDRTFPHKPRRRFEGWDERRRCVGVIPEGEDLEK